MRHSVFTLFKSIVDSQLWLFPVPRMYLEVCGTLEGLPADPAAVNTLLPMHLLAVVHEHSG